ncbi:MAG TPA: ABC transporter substrate-binding protein [Candidatus Eisenbergiella stercorigallinarum]|uniref:ABC transporter substrate-binding protein n=1 Tax=Candidatus Eisenbergiella stercorigallinarum TaxID=2838557 RepID=A0A9D2QXZ2_9FIRM|nr:ABC transporter substrate-binding protein [Candidatus Eisenbergiella stercorigallinarum]
MNRWIRKSMAILAAAAMAASMAGCGSASASAAGNSASTEASSAEASQDGASSEAASGQASSGSKDPIELTFWFANSDTVETYIGEATERFNSTVGAEKGIHVTAEYQGEYTDLHQKLQAAYIAGTAPQLTVLEIGAVGMFAQGGMIQSLDDRIEAEGMDMGDFHDGLLYNCYIDDSCYALPFLRSTSILYMNTSLLEQAGVNPDEIETWDDVAEASEKVKEATGKYGISMPINYWFHEAFMLTWGGFTVNEDETQCTVDNEVDRTVINYFKDLRDRGLAHLYPYAEADKMSADLMDQDAAFFFQSTGGLSQMLSIADELGFGLQTAFIPKGTQYGVTTGGCNIAMLSGLSEEQQNAAWEYIKFMTTVDETVEASIVTGYLATRKSAAEDPKMVEWYEQYPQYKVALDQLEISSGRPNNPGYVEFQAELTNDMAEIMVNDADVDTTLAELEAKGNELLNE